MDTRLTPLEKTEKKISIAAEVARLARMTVPQLRARHQELFCEPARSHHKEFLARQIAWRLQAAAEGGLPEETRQLALAIARPARIRSSAAARHIVESDRTATTRLKQSRQPVAHAGQPADEAAQRRDARREGPRQRV